VAPWRDDRPVATPHAEPDGTVFVPLKLAWKLKVVLAPAAMAPL